MDRVQGGRVMVVVMVVVGRGGGASTDAGGHVLAEVETGQDPVRQGRGGRGGPDVLEGQVHGSNGMECKEGNERMSLGVKSAEGLRNKRLVGMWSEGASESKLCMRVKWSER